MIRVYGDYVILVNNDEYTAAIDRHKKDKKGYNLYKDLGYYSTLSGALKGIYSHILKGELQKKEYQLDEAISVVKRITAELNEKIDKEVIF